MWALATTDTLRDGCLRAANLDDDADTTAAVYGEIAGRTCGEDAIPADRWERLALRDTIERLAHGLLALAEAM